jgi:hypothetical protein
MRILRIQIRFRITNTAANTPAFSRAGLEAEDKLRTYTEVINSKHKSTP